MFIRYVKADPTGNITALVESVSPGLGPSAAAEALFSADRSIEQLGFLSEAQGADIALNMAGGEFCGNASLCAAAFHLRRSRLENARVAVAISGADAPVEVSMRREKGDYVGRLDMPLPLAVEELELASGRGALVRFPGISHVIVPFPMHREEAEAIIAPLCRRLGAEALGLMLYDPGQSRLDPLVYVPGADTLCWEHSCASGTSALGAWLAVRNGGSVELELSQPGGSLGISAALCGGAVTRLSLCGRVRLGPTESLCL